MRAFQGLLFHLQHAPSHFSSYIPPSGFLHFTSTPANTFTSTAATITTWNSPSFRSISATRFQRCHLHMNMQINKPIPENEILLQSSVSRATFRDRALIIEGKVSTGFGRGSTKIGVPTANLPASDMVFLSCEPNGVYFGWAKLHHHSSSSSSSRLFRCVANLGFSPTFVNDDPSLKKRLVEAHLLHDFGGSQFYGDTMTLCLVGFLRPEVKFGSFPELIANIRNDVNVAEEVLQEGRARRLLEESQEKREF